MHEQVRDIVRVPLSLLTRLRLILFGHEDLAGIVFWAALIGICGALGSVAFREGTRALECCSPASPEPGACGSGLAWWHRVLVPVIGGVLAGLVLHLPDARSPRRMPSTTWRRCSSVTGGSARGTLVNALSSLLTISSGGSIGREGAMVQLAAMIGSKLGLVARAPIPRLRLMVACGGAAGIAAAYNAPISGALFVSEIVLGSIAMESFGPLVVASVTSSATIHRILGYGPVYDVPPVQFASNWELIFYVVLGVLLGHLAPPFLALLEFAKSRFARLRLPLYWQLGLGGLIVGVISIFVPQVWGNGYSVVGTILRGQLAGVWLLAVLGGESAGNLGDRGLACRRRRVHADAVHRLRGGRALRRSVHKALPAFTSVPAAYALIGMGGFLAATTHAPLTSILMLFEMTADYQIVLPLMLACVAAHYTAKVYRRGESVYHASLTRAFKAKRAGMTGGCAPFSALIKPVAAPLPRDATAGDVCAAAEAPVERVYVTDGNELVAWLDPREMLAQVKKRTIAPDATVASVARPIAFTLTPDMSLSAALEGFLREQATVLPVTPDQWRNTLLGEVSRHDLLLAIQDRMTYPK